MLRLIFCAALGSVCFLASTARGEDIAVSGFNEDVVTEVAAPQHAHRFDIYGASWIEDGITKGTTVGIGLPASGVIPSATTSGVVYHLRSYAANNVLRMGDNDPFTGTMTVLPGAYGALHILAASGTSGGFPAKQVSDIVLNFADGSVTLPNALIAHDWDASDNPPPANSLVIGGMDRNILPYPATTANGWYQPDTRHHFAMYETPLDLAALGLSGRVLESITFSDTSQDQATGVFAVDGTPVPEPGVASVGVALVALVRRRPRR